MSGRKYSQVELEAAVRETLAAGLAARDALARAEALSEALRAIPDAGPATRAAAEEIGRAVDALRAGLRTLGGQLGGDQLSRLELDQVVAHRRRTEKIRHELDEIMERARGAQEVGLLGAQVAALLLELNRASGELEGWVGDDCRQLQQAVTSLLQRIEAGGPLSADQRAALASAARGHEASREGLMVRAAENRRKDAERRYVASALRQVCTKTMGFGVETLPLGRPTDDLVLEIDTYAYGKLRFRLELAGTLRSDSSLMQATCCLNYATIEDRLKELGVVSSFRYEGDQQPVRLEKGSKELPGGDPAAAARGSST